MFLKKLRARNISTEEPGGILERARNERSNSPNGRTIADLAWSRNASRSKTTSSDRYLDEIYEVLGPFCENDNRFNTNQSKFERIMLASRFLVEFHKKFSECHRAIQRFEGDLRELCSSQSVNFYASGECLALDDLVRRAFMLSSEADRQFRSSFMKISELEETAWKRTVEVRLLRSKVNELETELMDAQVRLLREKCLEEVGSQTQKQSAVDALISALKESEKKRRQFGQELIRLKAIVESRNALTESISDNNIFQEIIELREVVKELSRKETSSVSFSWELNSFPRTAPKPIFIKEETDLTAREDEIFASFNAEMQKDFSESPRYI